MPARSTPPVPHRPCQGGLSGWLPAVQTAIDGRTVPGLTDTTLVLARALLHYADRDDGTTRPGLEHLSARTGLARRTLLAHVARLIDAGLLIRVQRGRHTSLTEQLHTGRTRNAAVYRLAHPQPDPPDHQPARPAQAPPPPPHQPGPNFGPVRSCTPPRSLSSRNKTSVAREHSAGLTAGGDTAPTGAGAPGPPGTQRRPPPRPGTRRWHRHQAAEALRNAAPLVFTGTSTAALASAIRHAHTEGWTTPDYLHLLNRHPLPALPDRLGGHAHLHHPAGLLTWRITHWFGQHGPLRPTTLQAHQRLADEERRRAGRDQARAERQADQQSAATADQVQGHTDILRRRMGWIGRRGPQLGLRGGDVRRPADVCDPVGHDIPRQGPPGTSVTAVTCDNPTMEELA